MKFVDEAIIQVFAGKGGDGSLSFRREKYIARGGPNGGDGGDGGSVLLKAVENINTLVDFRYQQHYRAKNGMPGMGSSRRGKSAEDLLISVPVGTLVIDADTNEVLGDLNHLGQSLCVAKAGYHGIGNERFKSSTNRSPRQTTKGSPGESRRLRLELRLIADVGLLGYPNAGKSTLLSVVSAAKPKIADYPFTTLIPQLGVVRLGPEESFVMADIPGLLEGASSGLGLGVKFLKHLKRTGLLLHVVDISDNQPIIMAQQSVAIVKELACFDQSLAEKKRWLVFNKIDTLAKTEADACIKAVIEELQWDGPVFEISAVTREGVDSLCRAVMTEVARGPLVADDE